MSIKLLFFAQSAGWMGASELMLAISAPLTVGDLILQPELGPLKEHFEVLRVAINQEFVSEDALIQEGDEVAFLPPVSGG